MDLWESQDWRISHEFNSPEVKAGLILKFEDGVDAEYKRASKEFCKWLRQRYIFPVRIPVYFKTAEYIISTTGEKFSALFFEQFKRNRKAYIRIATGDMEELQLKVGKDDALASLLCSIAHELTHYFQWINDVKLTDRGYELQAHYYASRLVDEYALTRDHP